MMNFPFYPWMKKEAGWVWPKVKSVVLNLLKDGEELSNVFPLASIRGELWEDLQRRAESIPKGPERNQWYSDLSIAIELALWDITKGVYCWDADFFQEVMDTELLSNKELPAEVLLQIPEPSIYLRFPYPIKLKESDGLEREMEGALAILECSIEDEEAVAPVELNFAMRLLICYSKGVTSHLVKFDKPTLAECLSEITAVDVHGKDKTYPRGGDEINFLASVINLVLYVCSLGADVTLRGEPAFPKKLTATCVRVGKKKKEWRIEAPSSIVQWDVGIREGSKLRRYKEQKHEETSNLLPSGRPSPRPHKRRAHWHLYHTKEGPKIKWIKTCLVNFPGGEAVNLPVVVRKMERLRQTTVMAPLSYRKERNRHIIKFGTSSDTHAQ